MSGTGPKTEKKYAVSYSTVSYLCSTFKFEHHSTTLSNYCSFSRFDSSIARKDGTSRRFNNELFELQFTRRLETAHWGRFTDRIEKKFATAAGKANINRPLAPLLRQLLDAIFLLPGLASGFLLYALFYLLGSASRSELEKSSRSGSSA